MVILSLLIRLHQLEHYISFCNAVRSTKGLLIFLELLPRYTVGRVLFDGVFLFCILLMHRPHSFYLQQKWKILKTDSNSHDLTTFGITQSLYWFPNFQHLVHLLSSSRRKGFFNGFCDFFYHQGDFYFHLSLYFNIKRKLLINSYLRQLIVENYSLLIEQEVCWFLKFQYCI